MREARNGHPKVKAHRYKTVDDAQRDGNVNIHVAEIRLKAQALAEKIRKEGPTSGQE